MYHLAIYIILLVNNPRIITFLRVYYVLIILLILLFEIVSWCFKIWKTCWLNVLQWKSLKILLQFAFLINVIWLYIIIIVIIQLVIVLHITFIGLIILIVNNLVIKLILKRVWTIFNLLLRMNIALENDLWIILVLIINWILLILILLILSIL